MREPKGVVTAAPFNQSEHTMTEQMKKSLASRKARKQAAEVAEKATAKQPKATPKASN